VTTQLHPFNAGGIPNFVQQAGMFQGLQNKKILSVTAADPQGPLKAINVLHQALGQLLAAAGAPAR